MYIDISKNWFSEEDLRSFLQEPARKAFNTAILQVVIGIPLLTVLIYGLLNAEAFLRFRQTPDQAPVAITTSTPTPTQEKPAILAVPETTPEPTPTPVPTPEAQLSIPNNTVVYSDLNISAPIFWDTAFDEKIIKNVLENGVVHLAGTAKPGQKGTVVITGHSSNYIWDKGAFNTVFTPLPKAKVGEKISLQYNEKTYTYEVSRIFKVKPTELAVLQAGSEDGLRLITCYPIGTSLERWIVEAKQITPTPSNNTPFTHSNFSGIIPKVN